MPAVRERGGGHARRRVPALAAVLLLVACGHVSASHTSLKAGQATGSTPSTEPSAAASASMSGSLNTSGRTAPTPSASPATVTVTPSPFFTPPPPQPGAPTVAISGKPLSGNYPLLVQFSSSVSGGTPPFKYAWNLGDNTTQSAADPSHSYGTPGGYQVVLTVTDAAGKGVQNGLLVSVSSGLAAAASGPPGAVDPTTGAGFQGSASGGKGPYTYLWDFGDQSNGSDRTQQDPVHSYSSPGTYDASLQVTDTTNGVTATSATVIVHVNQFVSGQASVDANPAGCYSNFTGGASGGTGSYTSWYWNFGDGSKPVYVQSPMHTWPLTNGNAYFTVMMTVTDSQGQSNTQTIYMTVNCVAY